MICIWTDPWEGVEGGGGGYSQAYNVLYREALSERGTFFML